MNDSFEYSSLEIWRDMLWEIYRPFYENNEKVYFVVDEFLIEEIAKEIYDDYSLGGGVEYFNVECNKLFIRYGTEVILKTNALEENDKGISYAICLAAQQILAVEYMEDHDFTHNAYYPRYCALLGVNYDAIPMSHYSFERIWKQLEKEILCIAGTTRDSITFHRGIAQRDKYRNYPMSQALLARHDVVKILRSPTVIENIDNDNLVNIIRSASISSNISERGRRVLYNDTLRLPLTDQIRNFYYSYDLDGDDLDSQKEGVIGSAGVFIVTIDKDDWEGDIKYTAYYSTDGTLSNIDSSDLMSYTLLIVLRNNQYVFFYEDFDVYKSTTDKVLLEAGKSYLLLTSNSRINDLCKALNLISCNIQYEIIVNIENIQDCSFIYIDSWPELDDLVVFNGDKLQISHHIYTQAIAFVGGICVDSRSNKYLMKYPPHLVLYKGNKLSNYADLMVNGIEKKLYQFLDELQAAKIDIVYLVEHSGVEVKISIVSKHKKFIPELGYSFDEGNNLCYFAQNAEVITHIDYNYYRLNIDNNKIIELEINIDSLELSKWLLVPKEYWIPINNNYKKKLFTILNLDRIESTYYKHLLQTVNKTNTVPPQIYKKLIT